MPALTRLNHRTFGLICCALSHSAVVGFGAGLYRDAVDARSLGMAGADAASNARPLTALFANPASLGDIQRPAFGLNLGAGLLRADYTARDGSGDHLRDGGIVPDAAVAFPLAPNWTLGFGITTDVALRADWLYRDQPGGTDGGTSYGTTSHRSQIINVRTSAALAWEPMPNVALGAAIGLVRNDNQLHAPYIFQSQKALRTVKTRLDLKTEGWGVNGQFGILWKPSSDVRVGLAYRSEIAAKATGRAHGNADRQLSRLGLGEARPDFAYDAEVTNVFPQSATLGAEWKATPRLSVAAQIEWVDWSRTFDVLVVQLRDGNNRDLNTLTGTRDPQDVVPLHWRDQWVWRMGAEYSLSETWRIRAGYSYARSPVPDDTLTPLTAVLPEHSLSTGVGWTHERWSIDVAWEWQIAASRRISHSILAAGEYANSSLRVSEHWFGITLNYEL